MSPAAQALSLALRAYEVPGLPPGELPDVPQALHAALSRANELRLQLDASIAREKILEGRVESLEQELRSHEFIKQMQR